jgi:aspartyl-tRNA(Asn)/glutamyl-tRNA(Gln) amidotransferase subunit A
MNFPLNILDVQKDISSGSTSCIEIVDEYLARIEEYKRLNAFIEVFNREAIERAKEIDQKFANGTQGKLAGLVIGIKDMISYVGHGVSASSKILEGFEAVYNSTVVQRLLDEDAIIIGRLNCDEFAMGASNETSFHGNVLNFADETRVSGGSSGGSAVAVQANLCMASLGTDTGGSIRQPASFCGIYGLKPTYSRVSRYGIISYASSFDQCGPLTNSIEDAALIMEVIAGADGKDAVASKTKVGDYLNELSTNQNFSIGLLSEPLKSEGMDKEIKDSILSLAETLKLNGNKVEDAHFEYLDYAVPTYYMLVTAEASSNLSRYDGVHFGYRSKNAVDLNTTYTKSRTEGFGEEVRRRIMLGTFVLSAGYYDAYYAKAQKARRLIRDATLKLLEEHDFIMLPTSPTTAFHIGEKIDDPIVMYLADIFTVQASLSGLPALNIPLGIHSNGMPFGVQLIGRKFEEGKLLAIAAKIEKMQKALNN